MEGSDATKQEPDVEGDSGGQEKLVVADNQQPVSDADLADPHTVTRQSAPPRPGALDSQGDE